MTCEEQISKTQKLIGATADKGNALFNGLRKNILEAIQKGQAAHGLDFRLYVTGYAQFFNEDDPQCDDVSWTYWSQNKNNGAPKLTRDKRKTFNNMAKALNAQIQAAVKEYEKYGAKFIDYDDAFEGHRYCEAGVKEPEPNNKNLWFYELNTDTALSSDEESRMYDTLAFCRAKRSELSIVLGGSQEVQNLDYYSILNKVSMALEEDKSFKAAGTYLGTWVRVFHPQRHGIDAIVRSFPGTGSLLDDGLS